MAVNRTRTVGLCVLAIAAFVAVGSGADGYALSGSDAIETPTQTVNYEGQEYTIDAVSRITAGGSVTVTTTVPAGAAYNVNLRGPDNQLISSERKTNSTDHTFSYFGPEEAGTYVATIEDNGNVVAVYPIVVAGYDVSVPSSNEVTAGETATIRATVTERSVERHSALDRVEVVVGNDDVAVQQSMTRVDDGTYETTVSTDGLAAGSYNVYVLVRGNETVRQRAEILGVSDTATLTVTDGTPTAEQSSDGDGDTTGGGAAGGGGDDSESDDEPTTPADEPTPTPASTETATDPGETSTAEPPATATGEEGSGESPASETVTDGGNVIAPVTQGTTPTTDGSGPGFTVGLALLALLAAVAIGRRR
ncbi:PGF-CTERM sorting domain-containing protein [Haloarcula onubensis]|uniref:PGF-CTERM sorting domain-containing protein n=1 Tax=Haloarcula onubensis TaxID=2950539 RepID=A0ABU2FJ38_9EURY|nr:PGF-CTERM sorting domain-containing protein [Halomicroarcula sp. S3CR25-11]MDS0280768.1 PGF-CTERM sorting domain-containing protein [Halomicroarcula sp. S3CR25-11]